MSRSHPFFAKNPHIMGIVNVTPDSFSDGGRYFNPELAIAHGLRLIEEGADSLDIGGESTRPGAEPVPIEDEIARVVPVIKGLQGCGVPISIDTRHADVMEAAIMAGADILNDISGFTHDKRSVSVAASFKGPLIVMHMQGTPRDMQKNPMYNNVIEDIFAYFQERLDVFSRARIEIQNVVLDPGMGFGKSDDHNLAILNEISKLTSLSCPVLLGASRKSFIGRISTGESTGDRLGGSIASVLWGLSQGVQFFRVHDVAATKQAITIWEAIQAVSSENSSSV